MIKKIFVLLIVIVVSTGSLFGCSKSNDTKKVLNNETNNFNKTGLPIVDKKITYTAIGKRRNDVSEFEGMPFFDMLEEKTNVHIDWECIPEESFNEKKNLMFASNELPDIFYNCLTWDDISKYYSSDYFLPLNNYIENYSEYYKKYIDIDKKILVGSTCNDGNIYTFANFNYFENNRVAPSFFVNKTWLDQLNIDVPKTIDDFYEMLKAFKNSGDINENGKDDEIPYTFQFSNPHLNLGALFGSFGYAFSTCDFIVDENNEVIYVPTTNEYKEGLKYFNKLYSEGLIDPEGFTQNNSVYTSKIRNNPSIVGASIFWNLNANFGERDEYDYEVLPPLIGYNGEQKWITDQKGPYSLHSPSIQISSDCKNPEIAFRWADYLYDLDNLIQSYNGMYDICIEKKEDGTIKQIKSKEAHESTPQLYAQTMSPGVNGIIVTTKEMLNSLEQIPEKYEKYELDKFYNKYNNQYRLPQMMYSQDEIEIKVELGADIDEYVKQMFTKFITNGKIDEQWDEYLNKLEKMNLGKYIELIKNKYKEYDTKLNEK